MGRPHEANPPHYQERMRLFFDYRLLRDWGCGRHWEKLFLLVADDSPWRGAVPMFRAWAMSNNELTYDMFGVRPNLQSDLEKDDICVVCYCDWEVEDLIV